MTSAALLSPKQMAEVDRLAASRGVPSLMLMEAAGRAVADQAIRMVRPGGRIAVICGPGNNGGDGFVAARLLKDCGFQIVVGSLDASRKPKNDAGVMAARWSGPVTDGAALDFAGADLIIDALFGAGLSKPVAGRAAEIVQRINDLGRPVLSIDVPSGLDGANGQALGPVIAATATVTFFRLKPGHLLLPGRVLCGETVLADIGIAAAMLDDVGVDTWRNAPALWRHEFPALRTAGHKYSRGHAVAVSGPAESTGACRLGARGALRIGAGLVTVASPRAAFPVNAAHLTAIMVKPFTVPDGLQPLLADKRRNAVLIGPGCGVTPETRAMVEIALWSGAHCVLDADALTVFAGSAANLSQLASANEARAVVLTPHEGEFKRLFPELDGDKLTRARAAAKLTGAVVVLKGPDTVIAHPDGRAAISDNAPPTLATAGSGDVLAGFTAGLLAQGMPAWEASCAAVWLHGDCANAFGPGLIAEDLPEALPGVLKKLVVETRPG